MTPGAEMRVRLDDRLGVAAMTYVLFGVKLGPALALCVVLVFAIWIGWRWLSRNIEQLPERFALVAPPPPALSKWQKGAGGVDPPPGVVSAPSHPGQARNAPNIS
jgi:hypothetical protein